VTVEAADLELPEKSFAVNVTVVTPMGNTPGASVVIAGDGSTTSVALAPERKAAIAGLLAGTPSRETACTDMPFGTVSAGGVVSTTRTVKAAVPVFW
jgi:hypothetical protein